MPSPSSGAQHTQNVPGWPGTSGTHPGQPPVNKPEPDYSGFWLADDGGMYFIRQFDTVLWWVGVNRGEPGGTRKELCPGLRFCNAYHASVTGPDITGDWSDVPRGTASNRGTLALTFGDDNQLHKVSETGGFTASTWQQWPIGDTQWPVITGDAEFQQTLKNVIGNADTTEKQTLADNLQLLKAPVTVFALIGADLDSHPANAPVSVSYPSSGSPEQGFSYNGFICLNDPAPVGGWLPDQSDCDATFKMIGDVAQIDHFQPHFFDGIDDARKDEIHSELSGEADAVGFEAEIIMFGRSADCGTDNAENYDAVFPGWAERPDSAVLFNGRPISITNFTSEISWRDPVRVTGALVFDTGHPGDTGEGQEPDKLEIHPVYSVDKITATFSGLSGAWSDDVGNTYYLRHDPADNTVWYVGLSPLGPRGFAQVFHGTFYPAPAVKDSAVPGGIGPPVVRPPQNVLMGDVVAIDLGWGTALPFEASGTRLGDTGQVTFEFGSGEQQVNDNLLAGNYPVLSMGDFRLWKLYDA